MDDQEIKYKPVEVGGQYYESVITRFTWWSNRAKTRTFVIGFVLYEPVPESTKWRPCTIGLLEEFNEDPVERPWQYIVDLVKAGELVKIIPVKQPSQN